MGEVVALIKALLRLWKYRKQRISQLKYVLPAKSFEHRTPAYACQSASHSNRTFCNVIVQDKQVQMQKEMIVAYLKTFDYRNWGKSRTLS